MSKLYLIPRRKRSKTVKKNEVDAHVDKVCARILSQDPTFTEVSFQGLGLTKQHAKKIASAIAHSEHVTKLDLSHNKLRDDGAACIAKALKVNRSINTIDITFNELSISGVILFASPLKSNLCVSNLFFSEQAKAGPVPMMWCCPLIAIQQLRLQHHLKANQEYNKCLTGKALSVNLTGRLLVSLPPEIPLMTHLRVLNISHNHLPTLPEAIGNLISLEELDASHNELMQLPSTLHGLQALVTLNLAHNSLQALPMTLASLPKLKSIDVRDNMISCLSQLPARLFVYAAELESISLGTNPWVDESVPKKLVQSSDGTSLLNYMSEYMADMHPRFRAAVLILGRPAVGKTSVARWLRRTRAPVPLSSSMACVRHVDNRTEVGDVEAVAERNDTSSSATWDDTSVQVGSGESGGGGGGVLTRSGVAQGSGGSATGQDLVDMPEVDVEDVGALSDDEDGATMVAEFSATPAEGASWSTAEPRGGPPSPSREYALLQAVPKDTDPKLLKELSKCEVTEEDLARMDKLEVDRRKKKLQRSRALISETPLDVYDIVWRLEGRYRKLVEDTIAHVELSLLDFKSPASAPMHEFSCRMLLSERSMVAVVFDMQRACPRITRAAEEELRNIHFSFRTAFSYIEHPTVLLVGTHADQCDADDLLSLRLRLSQLMHKHKPHAYHFQSDRLYDELFLESTDEMTEEPWVKTFVAVNSRGGKGMKQLRHSMLSELCNNLWMGSMVSDALMVLVEKMRVLRHSEYALSMDEFRRLSFASCNERTVNAPSLRTVSDLQPRDQERALELLNDLAVVVHVPDAGELSNWIFLNPRWLCDLYAKIVCYGGQLKIDPLQSLTMHIWPRSRVPEALESHECSAGAQNAFLLLLARYELLFELGEGQVAHAMPSDADEANEVANEVLYFIPYFLPRRPPSSIRDGMWSVHASPAGRRVWGRVFDFSLLPVGLTHRIIAKLHTEMVAGEPLNVVHEWTEGAFLYNKEGEEAWFFENPLRHCIYMQVFSRTGALLLKLTGLINDIITEHYARFSDCQMIGGDGVAPVRDVLIQCPHCVSNDLAIADCTWFLMSECLASAAMGNMYHYCDNLNLDCGRVPVRIDSMSPDITLAKLDHLKIGIDKLLLDRVVGQGSFGKVFRARLNGEVVAAKFMSGDTEGSDTVEIGSARGSSRASGSSMRSRGASVSEGGAKLQEKYAEFRKEVESMAGLSHPNIVSLKALCVTPLCVVTDFCARGDLQRYLEDHANKPLNLSFILRVAADMAQGMRFLHNATPRLTHCDFKSPNVLLNRWQNDEEMARKGDEDNERSLAFAAWGDLQEAKLSMMKRRTSSVTPEHELIRRQTFATSSLPKELHLQRLASVSEPCELDAASARDRNPLLRTDSALELTAASSRSGQFGSAPRKSSATHPPVVRIMFAHLKSAKTFPMRRSTLVREIFLLVIEKITREREVVNKESFSKTFVQFAQFCLAYRENGQLIACDPKRLCLDFVQVGTEFRELHFVDRKDTVNPEVAVWEESGGKSGAEQEVVQAGGDAGAQDDTEQEPSAKPSHSFVLDDCVQEFFDPSRVVAKIADFGLSTRSSLPQSKRLVANPLWLAPEIMRGESYSIESDVYGYGIVLWELFTRETPFRATGITFMSLLEEEIIKGLRPTIPEDVPDRIQELIRKCWANNPADRPTFNAIVDDITEIAVEMLPIEQGEKRHKGRKQWARKGEELEFVESDEEDGEGASSGQQGHIFQL